MKRVLIVISCLGVGGGERSLINLLSEFDYNQYSVDLLVMNDDGILMKQVPKEVHIIIKENRLKFLYNSFSLRDLLKKDALQSCIFRAYATIISRSKTENINCSKQYRWEHFYKKYLHGLPGVYDTVFAYMNDDAMYYVADKVQSPNKVAWIHNDYYAMKYDAEMDRRYFPLFNKVVTISDECLRILNEVFPEYRDKCMMIPNLTSGKIIKKRAKEFYPDEFKEYTGIKLLSIGRLSYQKGYDLAIDAAKKLVEKNVEFSWFVLGDGELREELSKRIAEAGVDKHFILCGIRDNPYPYLAYCDIFVQPSRFEGKSVALDEAKIFCKPIIATRYSTVFDQLEDGTNGLIVNMDGDAIANGIEYLISNPLVVEQLIDNSSLTNHDNIDMIELYYSLVE